MKTGNAEKLFTAELRGVQRRVAQSCAERKTVSSHECGRVRVHAMTHVLLSCLFVLFVVEMAVL